MTNNLRLIHLPADINLQKVPEDLFVLSTCQRTILFGSDYSSLINEVREHVIDDHIGNDAYSFLLQMICGLKSQVLGEYEVVSQFKQAYAEYILKKDRDSSVMRVLEKLFKDAKTVRSSHLLEIGSHTYGGLARKLIIKHSDEQKGRVLILGSGKLAEEALKLLTRKFDVYLSARNFDRVATLHDQHGIRPVEWFSPSLYREFSLIVNTIGSHESIYHDDFFSCWSTRHEDNKRVFIDLGSPSALVTKLGKSEGVYRLEDVFAFQEKLDEEKKQKLAGARAAIEEIVDRRQTKTSSKIIISQKDMEFV